MTHTICIAGKNSIAVRGLEYVLNNYSEKRILFLPNRTDNGEDGWQPSFRRFGLSRSVEQTTLEALYEIPDLTFISLEYMDIIKPEKFKTTELFNIHFSLLPKYKGMYTSAIPLINGEDHSGVTLHKINSGIDTGDIIDQIKFGISIEDNCRDLYFKYLHYSQELFVKNVDSLISKNFSSKPQPSIESSYFSRKSIDYAAVTINLNKAAFEIHNQFRAFTFREYQLPRFNEWQIIKTEITGKISTQKAGTVVEENDRFFVISSIDYNIKLYKDYYPMLWEAAKAGDCEGLDFAVKFIEDINLLGKEGWNALIIAAYNGSLSCVEKLLKCGANPSATNHKGTTVLMYAFSYYERSRDSRIFKMLLDAGADSQARDKSGKALEDYMIERACPDLLSFIQPKPL